VDPVSLLFLLSTHGGKGIRVGTRRSAGQKAAEVLLPRHVCTVPVGSLPCRHHYPLLFWPALVARRRGIWWRGAWPTPITSSSAASAPRASLRRLLPTWSSQRRLGLATTLSRSLW
jgi:hypothetical protein